MTAITDRLAPFAALEGVLFVDNVRKQPFYFSCGRYGNGHGAIQVYNCNSELECKLTVNLEGTDLGLGEFCVRSELVGPSSIAFDKIGGDFPVFLRTPRTASSGLWPAYAEVWRFAPCRAAAHACTAPFAVQCAACKREWERLFEEGKNKIAARDAVRRLSGKDYWPEEL